MLPRLLRKFAAGRAAQSAGDFPPAERSDTVNSTPHTDHVIRVRIINGPRDYVAYFKGWDNHGTPNSPRWVPVTTPMLHHAKLMADPLTDFVALKESIGPSAMAFLTTLDIEEREPATAGHGPHCSTCPERDDCMEAPE
jgi:hypothetical protein